MLTMYGIGSKEETARIPDKEIECSDFGRAFQIS